MNLKKLTAITLSSCVIVCALSLNCIPEDTAENDFLIGGASSHESISFQSNRYRVITYARKNENGVIYETKHEELSSFEQYLLSEKSDIMPKSVRFLCFLGAVLYNLGTKEKALLLIEIALVTLFLLYIEKRSGKQPRKYRHVHTIGALVILITALTWTGCMIAPWHGAEHRAVAVFLKGGIPTVALIAEEDSVSPKCGGRFFLPFLLLFAACSFAAHRLKSVFAASTICLLLFELTLQIDSRIGYDKMPVFKTASALLQRHITTAEPNQIQMKTAETSFQRLLELHHNKLK